MRLLRAEPGQGIVWIRRAFQTFLKQPFGLAGLFALCALIAVAMSAIPIVSLLWPVLAPAGALVFMIATARAESGQRPIRGAFATLFAAGRTRLMELLKLGAAYLATSFLAILAFSAFDSGSATTWSDAVSSTAASAPAASAPASMPAGTPAPPPDLRILLQMLLQMAVFIALSVPFWHAPAVVFWGRQGWARSLFFSTLAIWRNRGAFAVYGLGWFGILFAFFLAFKLLALLFTGTGKISPIVALLFVSGTSFFLTWMYTSIWFTVTGCFAIDGDAAESPPSSPKETLP